MKLHEKGRSDLLRKARTPIALPARPRYICPVLIKDIS